MSSIHPSIHPAWCVLVHSGHTHMGLLVGAGCTHGLLVPHLMMMMMMMMHLPAVVAVAAVAEI